MRVATRSSFEVCDAGPGIPVALRGSLGTMPVDSTQGGHGVGLYLAFSAAARLKGSIELTDVSEIKPRGTRAVLRLPLAGRKFIRRGPSRRCAIQHGETGMSDMNFLVIDDDEVFSGILARGLTRRGYTVAEAHNADEAIKLANQQKFSQITVDLHLGNDSGLTLVAPLRDLQPDARMLVLTGYASIATAVQAVKDGADNYLAKPANVETILSALQSEASALQAEEAIEHPTPLSVARLEWEHIQRVLAEHGGNISATARALNMHRRTLQRKLAKRPVRQ